MMSENEVKRISNGLKQGPGYVIEGRLATLKMVPVEVSKGKAAVYFVVWSKKDGEALFLNLLPAGKLNEGLVQELLDRLKQAIEAGSERKMQKQLSKIGRFIVSLTKEQDAESN